MIALNHTLTGGLVAVTIGNPIIGIPAAFASHFLIDMLPHWNYKIPGGPKLHPIVIGIDMVLSVLAIILLGWALDFDFWLFALGGFVAVVPDAMWLPYILHNKPTNKAGYKPLPVLRRFHQIIQWSETTKGLAVEGAWLILMLSLVIWTGT